LNDEEKYSLHDKHTAKNRYLFEHAMQILPSTPEKDLQHGLDMTYGRNGKKTAPGCRGGGSPSVAVTRRAQCRHFRALDSLQKKQWSQRTPRSYHPRSVESTCCVPICPRILAESSGADVVTLVVSPVADGLVEGTGAIGHAEILLPSPSVKSSGPRDKRGKKSVNEVQDRSTSRHIFCRINSCSSIRRAKVYSAHSLLRNPETWQQDQP
jgi:hypothetical protein